MDDRLVTKLAQIAVRRELRERRLSLAEALEILSDLGEAGDGAEATRWRAFVMDAHERGDFRFTSELTRPEWAAVMHGRNVPVWSQPEITLATQRFRLTESATWARDAKPDPVGMETYAEMKRANREGRVMFGPGGVPVMFRSAADPLRDETPDELASALNHKVSIVAAGREINAAIDATLERVNARLPNGEAVLSSVAILDTLEQTINAAASIPSGIFGNSALGRMRLADVPRWGELLKAYGDGWSKMDGGRANRAADVMRNLEAAWAHDDQEARVLAERVIGSPDPLSPASLAAERAISQGVVVPRGISV